MIDGGDMKKKDTKSGLAAFLRSMQFPEDSICGHAMIHMQGQERICVENFTGIALYTEHEIQITAKQKKIHIIGKHLKIDGYTKGDIEVSGSISKIEFQ